jgi:CPA2 family monovalent cation:H+ antiporter-2
VRSLSDKLERGFLEGFEAKTESIQPYSMNLAVRKLVPWEAHLASVSIPVDSPVLGKTLLELSLRERFGINVVAINRDHLQILAPSANERVYPHDVLMCFASDSEIEAFTQTIRKPTVDVSKTSDNSGFTLRQITVPEKSVLSKRTIKQAGIYTKYNCLVVGIERKDLRIKSPKSDQVIEDHDVIWLIGSAENLQKLVDELFQAS